MKLSIALSLPFPNLPSLVLINTGDVKTLKVTRTPVVDLFKIDTELQRETHHNAICDCLIPQVPRSSSTRRHRRHGQKLVAQRERRRQRLFLCNFILLASSSPLFSLLSLMSQYNQPQSSSPPPLRHPVPTHPAYIPEPPLTPASPQGYQRYTSSPGPGGSGGSQFSQQQTNTSQSYGGFNQRVQAYPGMGSIGSQKPQPQPFTSPFQHSQPQQTQGGYSGNMDGHQQQAGGPYANQQDFAAWGLDGTTAQLGMQLGHSAVAAGQDYVQKNVSISHIALAIN